MYRAAPSQCFRSLARLNHQLIMLITILILLIIIIIVIIITIIVRIMVIVIVVIVLEAQGLGFRKGLCLHLKQNLDFPNLMIT